MISEKFVLLLAVSHTLILLPTVGVAFELFTDFVISSKS